MSAWKSTRRRRIVLAIAMAGGVSAASLGGIRAADIGADGSAIGSCDIDGVDVKYRTVYHPPSRQYRVNRVDVRNVDQACNDLPFQLTLFDGNGGSYGTSGTLKVLPNGIARIRVSYSAESVNGVALLIGGTAATP